jgi:hypothetical protein
MTKASATDLKTAHAQGTILTIEYKGVWYGNGTVGDASSSNKSSRTNKKVSYSSDYYYGWADDMEAQWAAYGMSHSAAGAASVLVCGFALAKAYKRMRRRSVELEEGERRQNPLL